MRYFKFLFLVLIIQSLLLTYLPSITLNSQSEIYTSIRKISQSDWENIPQYFFVVIGKDSGREADYTENIISIPKSINDINPIYINLEGFHYYEPSYHGNVYFRFEDPSEELIEEVSADIHGFYNVLFTVDSTWAAGLYKIYVLLNVSRSQDGCCLGYDYKTSYQGMSSPPLIEGRGNQLLFSENFVPIRMYTNQQVSFCFYGDKNERYELIYLKGVLGGFLDEILLTFPNDTFETITVNKNELYDTFNIQTTDPGIHTISFNTPSYVEFEEWTGFRLTLDNGGPVTTRPIIPLLSGSPQTDTDSDGDLLLDPVEIEYGTSYIENDSDSDSFNDYIEIYLGSDPLNRNSVPFEVITSIPENYNSSEEIPITYELKMITDPKNETEILFNFIVPKNLELIPDSQPKMGSFNWRNGETESLTFTVKSEKPGFSRFKLALTANQQNQSNPLFISAQQVELEVAGITSSSPATSTTIAQETTIVGDTNTSNEMTSETTILSHPRIEYMTWFSPVSILIAIAIIAPLKRRKLTNKK